MALKIHEASTSQEILELLEQSNLGTLSDVFKGNQVDGEDFFDLEMSDLVTMIPILKLRKKFISVWSKVTGLTFDCNGVRVPLKVQEPELAITPTTRRTSRELSFTTPPPSSNIKRSAIASAAQCLDASMSPEFAFLESRADAIPTARRCLMKRSSSTIPCSALNSKGTLIVSSVAPCHGSMSPALSLENKQIETTSFSISSIEDNDAASTPGIANWIYSFCIPTRWEPIVEAGLKRGQLTRDEKSAMTRQLCTIILSHTATVSRTERDYIAISLIRQYPFLSEYIGPGYKFWSKKIKDRLMNLRKKFLKDERKKLQEQGIQVPKTKTGRKRKAQQQELGDV